MNLKILTHRHRFKRLRAVLSQTTPDYEEHQEQAVDQLKNFLPVIIFVAVYVFADIYAATAALMIAVTLQVGWYLLRKKPLSMELKATFWVGLVMGSLTLILRDPQFIQWKTTIINWFMASALIATHFFGKSYGTEVVLKKLLLNAAEKTQTDGASAESPEVHEREQKQKKDQEQDPDEIARQKPLWRTVNLIWISSFVIAGVLNLVVVYNFSFNFWVTYKVVGGMALSMITIVISMVYLYKKGLLDNLIDIEEPPAEQSPQ